MRAISRALVLMTIAAAVTYRAQPLCAQSTKPTASNSPSRTASVAVWMTTWVPDGDSLALRRSARGITGPMMGDALRDVVDNVRLPEEAIRGARALIAQDRVGAQLSALPGRSWPDTVTIDGQTVRTQQPGASGLLTDTIVDRSRYLTKRKIGDHQWASTMMTQSLGQPRTIATTFTSDVDGEIYALGNVNWRLTNAGQLTSIMVIQTSTGRRISRK